MISEWNNRIRPITMEIEQFKPQILDDQKDTFKPQAISDIEARDIYYSVDPTSAQWKLKTTFIALLNELEQIAAAYENGIGDSIMIEQSFRDTFLRWGDVLEKFITLYQHNRGNQEPWGPFHNLYRRWKDSPINKKRRSLA